MTLDGLNRQPQIGNTRLQAPIGLAPFNSGMFGQDGSIGTDGLSFYRSFCNDRLGLLCVGGLAVAAAGRANRSSMCLDRDERAHGLRLVCETAHAAGVKVAVQIEHAGRQTGPHETGLPSVAATAAPCPVVGGSPSALSLGEISLIVDQFVHTAEIAARAGADLIEVHAAHGYLLSGFLSAATNTRQDRYGGNLERRFRIVHEIVTRAHAAVGHRIGIRINVHEDLPGGMTPDQAIAGLRNLRTKLAYISISGGMYTRARDVIIPRRTLSRALWRDQAATVRTELGVPVMIAGNIDTPELAASLLEHNVSDVVLFGRSLLADPDMLISATTGRQIQPCTDCGQCKYHTKGYPHIYCPFHPTLRPLRSTWKRRRTD
ncbi:oxidoreductase [Paractinoplanes toevensis]|uniref:oxidoreductase n=1 Tax=Paractinoplanes toevensis TaxID=571911 RepID=UPI001BB3CFED|nr:NADH:flavin oxidoreductase [Actinoplanes toevensis]